MSKTHFQKKTPKDMETSPTPVETSQKSDGGQSPKDMETGPTPVETSLKTDQLHFGSKFLPNKTSELLLCNWLVISVPLLLIGRISKGLETGPTPEETNQKADQEQCPSDMETSLKTD